MKWNALQRCDRPATRNRGSPRLVHSCTALAPLPRPLRDCADEYRHPTRPRSSLCGSAANGRCAPAAASQAHKMLWRITTPCSPPCMSASTSADPYARGYPALPNHTSYVHAPAWACRALHASARTPARPHEDARTRTGADALLCLSTQSQAVHAKALEDSHHPQRPAQLSSAQHSCRGCAIAAGPVGRRFARPRVRDVLCRQERERHSRDGGACIANPPCTRAGTLAHIEALVRYSGWLPAWRLEGKNGCIKNGCIGGNGCSARHQTAAGCSPAPPHTTRLWGIAL
jgi:hypothetical protein